MNKFRRIAIFVGVGLCAISVLLLLATRLFPHTYFIIALSNTFIPPFVWGMFFIMIFLLLKKEKMKIKVIIKKFIYAVLLIPLIGYSLNNPILDSVRDIEAVMSDELYVTEGKIIDTYINRISSSQRVGDSDRHSQSFKLNNENQDEFILPVAHKDDYVFEVGQTYRIIALPHSRTILDFEQVDQ